MLTKLGLVGLIIFFCSTLFAGESTQNLYEQGIGLIRQKRYDEAIQVLEKALENRDVQNQAPIYYFIGLAQYSKEEYENAISTLETAMDISRNPKLDDRIERAIDKVIRRQQFLEATKLRNKIWYFLGLGYDSNILNLSADSFPGTSLSGYTATYGGGYSYAVLLNPDYSVVPEINVSDSYSTDSKLAANSTLQSVDALQVGVLVPLQIQTRYLSDSDYTRVAVSYKNIYLPITNSQRSLAFTSLQLTLSAVLQMARGYYFNPQFYYADEKSKVTYASEDDQQTASRYGVGLNNQFLVGSNHSLFFNFEGEKNQAKGRNEIYDKAGVTLAWEFQFAETFRSRLQGQYVLTDYSQRDDPRHDKATSANLDILKFFSDNKALTFTFGFKSNTSNNSLYQYSDSFFAFIFSDLFSF